MEKRKNRKNKQHKETTCNMNSMDNRESIGNKENRNKQTGNEDTENMLIRRTERTLKISKAEIKETTKGTGKT